ncbi:hypothetical protein EJB05_55500, partial [Eragrostis curvula]
MASTCGGGGGRGGRSPLSRRRLDLFTCVLACSFFGAARGRQLQQPPPPLEVRTYSYASFEAGGLRESRDLKLSPDARINSGALQLTPDTRNNPSYLMHGRGALLGAVDQHLGTAAFDADEATRLLLLGLACSSPNPADRPTMPQVLQILAKAQPPPEVPLFKPTFVWPPEGGTQFDLSDIGLTSSSAGGAGNGGASSAMATQDTTSFDSMQAYTAPNTTGDYFQALSTGR